MDAYKRLREQAASGAAPKPEDNFRWRYHGLFYVAPAQTSYMCRLRIPNGVLTHWQLAAIADLAERHGGGYAHVTTRANLQIREIAPENAPAVIETLTEVGIVAKGAGPTTSAMSRAPRPPASIRSSSSTRARTRGPGTTTS